MSDEIRSKIVALLAEAGISFNAALLLKGARDNDWEHDCWAVGFMRTKYNGTAPYGASLQLPFKTGIGHRRQLGAAGVPQPPHPADVLYSVVMDDTRGASFREWCSEYGYDEDSRKALATYEQCQNQTTDAQLVFGRELLEQIAEQLQDY